MEKTVEPLDSILIKLCGKIFTLSTSNSSDAKGEIRNYIEYLHDLFLQLFICYWRNYNTHEFHTTSDKEQVDIVVINEEVIYARPTHVLSYDIHFDERFKVRSLYVDHDNHHLHGKADRFVQDFISFIQKYEDILPFSLKNSIYSIREKYSMLNYLLKHRSHQYH